MYTSTPDDFRKGLEVSRDQSNSQIDLRVWDLSFAQQTGKRRRAGIPGGGCSSPAKRSAKASAPGVGRGRAAAVAQPVVAGRGRGRAHGGWRWMGEAEAGGDQIRTTTCLGL